MEEYRVNPQPESGIFSMEVDEVAKATLLETARWTKFLAVIGIIMLSLFLLAGLGMSTVMSSVDSSYSNVFSTIGAVGMIAYFLVIVAIQIYPVYCLFTFSRDIKYALNAGDKVKFNTALSHMKGLFKYFGIITIILISLYGLMIIFMAIGLAMH